MLPHANRTVATHLEFHPLNTEQDLAAKVTVSSSLALSKRFPVNAAAVTAVPSTVFQTRVPFFFLSSHLLSTPLRKWDKGVRKKRASVTLGKHACKTSFSGWRFSCTCKMAQPLPGPRLSISWNHIDSHRRQLGRVCPVSVLFVISF